MPESRPSSTARVFFALWPDDRVRRRLYRAGQQLQAKLGGRLAREPSVHMTLLFLGEVEEARLDDLRAGAAPVAAPAFTMALDIAGCWRHNRVAWIGSRQVPPELTALVVELRMAIGDAGFAFDRKPFASHVTLVRNARCTGDAWAIEPIVWEVEDFVLVRSALGGIGSAYTVIGRWPGPQAI